MCERVQGFKRLLLAFQRQENCSPNPNKPHDGSLNHTVDWRFRWRSKAGRLSHLELFFKWIKQRGLR